MKNNFDEKLLTFEKTLKWDKIDLDVLLSDGSMKMDQHTVSENTEKLDIMIEEIKDNNDSINAEFDFRSTPGFPMAPVD